jgi:hypothetical protein
VRRFRRVLTGKGYGEFFASRSRVSGLQFLGLILLGAGLITSGTTLLVMTLLKFSLESLDAFEVVVLLICTSPCFAIMYFGVLHIRRALVGRH